MREDGVIHGGARAVGRHRNSNQTLLASAPNTISNSTSLPLPHTISNSTSLPPPALANTLTHCYSTARWWDIGRHPSSPKTQLRVDVRLCRFRRGNSTCPTRPQPSAPGNADGDSSDMDSGILSKCKCTFLPNRQILSHWSNYEH